LFVSLASCFAANAFAARLSVDLPGASIPVDTSAAFTRATLTLSGPDGRVTQYDLAGGANRFELADVTQTNGQYRYRIDFLAPSAGARAGNGPDGRAQQAPTPGVMLAPVEGTFRVDGGHVYVAGAVGRKDATSPAPNDVVTADDVIIQGSACIGLDCVDNESFGFDTLRLKENNTRIHSWTPRWGRVSRTRTGNSPPTTARRAA